MMLTIAGSITHKCASPIASYLEGLEPAKARDVALIHIAHQEKLIAELLLKNEILRQQTLHPAS
jgi:hypothetical protein